jgi:hypothetical protein
MYSIQDSGTYSKRRSSIKPLKSKTFRSYGISPKRPAQYIDCAGKPHVPFSGGGIFSPDDHFMEK